MRKNKSLRTLKRNAKSKRSKLLIAGLLTLMCIAVFYIARTVRKVRAEAEQEDVPERREESPEPVEALSVEAIKNLSAGSVINPAPLSETERKQLFYSTDISDAVFERINGISYKENENIYREDLSYLRVLHMGFDNQTHVGELIVNRRIAAEILAIFQELYANAYPIEKMLLVDEYQADDNLSMADNNTSAFNYRVIAGTSRLSRHSLGMAIDINPKYNPYVRSKEGGETIIEPEGSEAYVDRTAEFSYKIDESDLAYQLFTRYGFTWGGDWNTLKDYQHFEKE